MTAAIRLEEVEWLDPRAAALRAAMDTESFAKYESRLAALAADVRSAVGRALATDGAEMVATIMAFEGDEPVGHAALRPAEGRSLEVKKVFVPPAYRSRGISKLLMLELERIARDGGFSTLVLQTGDLQREAVALYHRLGYREVPPFRDYAVVPFALCFEKDLDSARSPA